MTKRQQPDLVKAGNDLELLNARVEALVHEVEHLTDDLAELARKTADFATVVRGTLADIREQQLRGMR